MDYMTMREVPADRLALALVGSTSFYRMFLFTALAAGGTALGKTTASRVAGGVAGLAIAWGVSSYNSYQTDKTLRGEG